MTPNTTKQAPINSLVLISVQDTNEPIGQQSKYIAATDFLTKDELEVALTITSPDATDLNTSMTLLNEIKTKLNAL